ncbi:hypothetical protein TrCOL_g6257 [Triparma columacea]|uniref:Uncharacterized protein n=1 Tax=Triparma columacea TaxID=722753 RepID=A0A9W7G322_9STRA|nr:hypothetical protein TrCOL_g6257 [Triparma columacea]
MSENINPIDSEPSPGVSIKSARNPFRSLNDSGLQFNSFSSWKQQTMQTKIDGLKTYSEFCETRVKRLEAQRKLMTAKRKPVVTSEAGTSPLKEDREHEPKKALTRDAQTSPIKIEEEKVPGGGGGHHMFLTFTLSSALMIGIIGAMYTVKASKQTTRN